MIPISEIERVIAELESVERQSKRIGTDRGYAQARGIAFAIYKLKELIPSEQVPSQESNCN